MTSGSRRRKVERDGAEIRNSVFRQATRSRSEYQKPGRSSYTNRIDSLSR